MSVCAGVTGVGGERSAYRAIQSKRTIEQIRRCDCCAARIPGIREDCPWSRRSSANTYAFEGRSNRGAVESGRFRLRAHRGWQHKARRPGITQREVSSPRTVRAGLRIQRYRTAARLYCQEVVGVRGKCWAS